MSELRALVGARVSVLRDEKTSHLSQRETGEKYARDHGMSIVDYFNDLGVSAEIAPFDRPDLGPWLTDERAHMWDVLILSKVDRAFRSSYDCATVAKWAEQHSKILVFTDDGIILNYRDPADSFAGMLSKFFLTVASLFGEMELRRFKERAQGAHSFLRTTDRWASGVPPLGYQTVDHPSGHGKTLATDEYGRDLLHDMADKLLDGWSFTAVANHLNETGALTNMARARGQQVKWHVDTVIRAMTTLRTQGIKMSGEEPVIDDQGDVIHIAEPTFTAEKWDRIQLAAKERSMSGKRRAMTTNPVLGIGYCSECRASLTRKDRGRGNVYLRCGRTPKACKGVGIRLDEAEQMLEEVLTSTIGHLQVTRRVFVPGTDNSRDLEQVTATIARLRRESDAGLLTTAADEEEYLGRMRVLVARRDSLADSPVSPAGWRTEYDAETYSERYAALGADGRRDLLRDSGIRFYVSRDVGAEIMIPEEIDQRLGAPAGSAVFTDGDTSNPPPFWPELQHADHPLRGL